MVSKNAVLSCCLVLAAAIFPPGAAAAVQTGFAIVDGVRTDFYRWTDSRGRPRTVFLKRQGQGNPGNGGYAVRMIYQVKVGAVWQTVTANQTPGGDGGFGYFVSHERQRDYTDGTTDTAISWKIFNRDDSPLGRGFPVVGAPLAIGSPNARVHRFRHNYPRYGTIAPIPKNVDGEDVSKSPITPASYRLYSLPIVITWVFQDGKDYPRINVRVNLVNVPGPDRGQLRRQGALWGSQFR